MKFISILSVSKYNKTGNTAYAILPVFLFTVITFRSHQDHPEQTDFRDNILCLLLRKALYVS